MRNPCERFGTASAHHDRRAHGERPLPALPRTSRYRFHDDDNPDQAFEDSGTTPEDAPDSDAGAES